MKQRLAALLITLGAFLSFPNTGRASTMFIANLTTSQENPPTVPTLDGVLTPRPTSGGSGTFVLNDAMTELSFSITVTNIDFGRVPSLGTPVVNPPTANPFPQTAGILNDDLLAAHFHRGPVGTNGPVIFGFIGTPFNDNNPNNVVVTPTPGGIGATVTGIWNLGEGNGTTLTAEIPPCSSAAARSADRLLRFPNPAACPSCCSGAPALRVSVCCESAPYRRGGSCPQRTKATFSKSPAAYI